MSQKALLLINPHARRGEETRRQAIDCLQRLGFELIEESAEDPGKISDWIRFHRHQVNCVIIGGGDGSVNAAIAGLLDTRLPLGVLPLGTANNLARTLGIPTSISEACQTIAQGKPQAIDLGWVNGQYFLNVAGMGISTAINRQVDKGFKRRWGVIAYAVTALRVISRYRRFSAIIRCNGDSIRVRTFQITVCNGRYYGSGIPVAVDAAIDDQRLDLCSIEIQHWWQVFRILPAIMRGEYATVPGMRMLQGQEIQIITAKPKKIDTDGEITTTTPAQFRLVSDAITVFAPPR